MSEVEQSKNQEKKVKGTVSVFLIENSLVHARQNVEYVFMRYPTNERYVVTPGRSEIAPEYSLQKLQSDIEKELQNYEKNSAEAIAWLRKKGLKIGIETEAAYDISDKDTREKVREIELCRNAFLHKVDYLFTKKDSANEAMLHRLLEIGKDSTQKIVPKKNRQKITRG